MIKIEQIPFKLFVLVLILVTLCFCHHQKKYDLAILNGQVITGDGNPWFRADIGIRHNKVAYIGKIPPRFAEESIDAHGLMVCPGFIDIHTHADETILDIPTADNYILQGVTTVLGGNCGFHHFPLKSLYKELEDTGISLNFCCLVGHNTIRKEVMGMKMSPPTATEIGDMKKLLKQEMDAGGMGLSTGLAYMPGTYAGTDEIIAICEVLKEYDGLYASHIRNQGDGITGAIEEAIRIGEENGIRVQISHIKLAKDTIWGKMFMITDPIEKARTRGIEVTIDQYPYTATSSGFASSFPSWALEGGDEELKKRLKNPDLYKKIQTHIIKARLTSSKGIDKLKTIYIANFSGNPQYEGKNLYEILNLLNREPTVGNAADLIIEIHQKGGAQGVFFQMDEADVEKIMGLEYNMIASDSAIVKLNDGVPHCRNYGTFPRILHHYVKKRKLFSMEEAIRKMTSLPAQTIRLPGRGLIKTGFYADMVIFDPSMIRDKATYQKPHQYPAGIRCVLVNGVPVVNHGKITGLRPGYILRNLKI